MLEFNIAPNTQIGRINIPDKVYFNENAYHIEEGKYSRSGEFIENMVTDNMIEYCHRWFHLASFKEFIEDIDEFFGDRGNGKFSNLQRAGFGLYTNQKTQIPVEFDRETHITPILFVNNSKPNELAYESINERGKVKYGV